MLPNTPYLLGGRRAILTCGGTNVTPTHSQDDLTGWTLSNITATAGQSDPIGGTSATKLVAASTFAGNAYAHDPASITLTGGVPYAVKVYLKPVAGSTWVIFGFSDFTANAFQSYFNLSGNGSVGNQSVAGTGTLTCAKISPSTSGYYLLSIGGNYSASNSSAQIAIGLTDGNGLDAVTINQEVWAYHVGSP